MFNEELKQLLSKYNIDINSLKSQIEKEEREEANRQVREICEQNKSLVGKHFTDKDRKYFIKVVSERATSAHRVTCIIFPKHPTYNFKNNAHMMFFAGDFYLGKFELTSMKVEEVMAEDIKHLKEITKEEYNQAMVQYTNELCELQFKTQGASGFVH